MSKHAEIVTFLEKVSAWFTFPRGSWVSLEIGLLKEKRAWMKMGPNLDEGPVEFYEVGRIVGRDLERVRFRFLSR